MTKKDSLKYKFGLNKRIQDFLDILDLDPENQYDLTNIPNLIYYFKDVERYDFNIQRMPGNHFHFSLGLSYKESIDKEDGSGEEEKEITFYFKKIYKNLHCPLINLLKLRWIYYQEDLIKYKQSKGYLTDLEKSKLESELWYHMDYFTKLLNEEN